MWGWILRHTAPGLDDETQHERSARYFLEYLLSLGNGYGLWYAVLPSSKALEEIGASLSTAFSGAGPADVAHLQSLLRYTESKHVYDRQVDVHSHWIGLDGLIVLGLCFDRVSFSEKTKLWRRLDFLAGRASSSGVLFSL